MEQRPQNQFDDESTKESSTPDFSHGWYGEDDSSPKTTQKMIPVMPEDQQVFRQPPQVLQKPSTLLTHPLKSQPGAPGFWEQVKKKLATIHFVPPKPSKPERTFSCLLQASIISIFAVVILISAGAGFAFLTYQNIKNAHDFPDVRALYDRAAKFETTYILDRDGNVLYEIIDPYEGKRTHVPLDQISPNLIAATIATEDKEYFNHPGFDPVAIARALLKNLIASDIESGASTITQQLARIILLDPEERYEISYRRKAKEIVVAAELTRIYSKEEILEIYLNQINYGNLSYGIEAAAKTYFNTPASDLTLGEASFLAGLPQAPAVWDVFQNPEGAINRQSQVLTLTQEMSAEKGCIFVSNEYDRVCVSPEDAATALVEILNYEFVPPAYEMRYPHWVFYIYNWLFSTFDTTTIYQSGFTIYTTIDPRLQEIAQEMVAAQVTNLGEKNVQNGALISMQPSTGEILAMVGSVDFYNEEISGQVNMAISPRQPGSSIKPLVYLVAFEKEWTASTLIWDIPTEFTPSGLPDEYSEPYKPVNYDRKYHGPVTVRSALANSYNIPAVAALQYVSVYDNQNTPEEDGFINFAERMGITTFTRDDYGLSIALGGGEVSLLELTNAYAIMANRGRQVTPTAVLKIIDRNGNTVYQAPPQSQEAVISPEHAFLISSILSDNTARTPMFGANSFLALPFPAAAKTGTTNDYRDSWTMGYTPDLVTGVWLGNADYTEMDGVSGYYGAAPVWSQFMQSAVPLITNNNPSAFIPTENIVERTICAVSGTEPSEKCPNTRTEYFAYGEEPLEAKNDLWADAKVDPWTLLGYSEICSSKYEVLPVLNVSDENARAWIRGTDQGREWAASIGFLEPINFVPLEKCSLDAPQARVEFAFPNQGETITNDSIGIYAIVTADKYFDRYKLYLGEGENPTEWTVLKEEKQTYPQPGLLHTVELNSLPNGVFTLRIVMFSNIYTKIEARVTITLNHPTATPTPKPTATPTMTVTPTPTATPTSTVTPTNDG